MLKSLAGGRAELPANAAGGSSGSSAGAASPGGLSLNVAMNVKRMGTRMASKKKRFGREFEGARFPLAKILKDEFGLRVVQLCKSIVDMMGISCYEDGPLEPYEERIVRRAQARAASSSRGGFDGLEAGADESPSRDSRGAAPASPGLGSPGALVSALGGSPSGGARDRSRGDGSPGAGLETPPPAIGGGGAATPGSAASVASMFSPGKKSPGGGILSVAFSKTSAPKRRLRPVMDSAGTRFRSVPFHYARVEVGNSRLGMNFGGGGSGEDGERVSGLFSIANGFGGFL